MKINSTLRTLFAATALSAAALIAVPTPQAHAAVVVSVAIAPPAIPVYTQPVMPGDGYIWTPGYWAYGPDGYYWVDGAWVEPPYAGALWTPGWWGFYNGAYAWYPGYWGRTVGYYGGVNYGFGYFGVGFYGGYWNGGHFFYNSAYNHLAPGFRGAVYSRRVSGFDGRPGGAAFAAHPPAQFANAHAFSGVHGAVVEHGGAQGFANRGAAAQGFADRGNAGANFNRPAPAANGANRAPAPHSSAPARGGSAPAAHSAPSRGGSSSHSSEHR